MQSYTEIPSSQSLQSSLALLLNNDKTLMSCSSGSAFPTANLQVGMMCLRTDQNKLYQLQSLTPTWTLLVDLNLSNANIKFSGSQTTGVLDWNDVSNTTPGYGPTLLLGTAANGPGLGAYYHVLNFEYSTNDGTGNVTQLAIPYGDMSTTQMWIRGRYSNTWSPWVKMLTSSDVGSGKGLDADLLDGYHAGNGTGQVPVSNGTKNTNLNADLLDGFHAGNGTGQIPVSSGSVNTNLNADMLDGYHAASFVRTIQGVAPDGSGNVAVDLASRVLKTGDVMTGDLTIYRSASPTTGVIFLGNSGSRYLYYDGTNYNMPAANLIVNGGTVWHSGNIGTPLNAVHGALGRSGNSVGLAAIHSGSVAGSANLAAVAMNGSANGNIVKNLTVDAYGRVTALYYDSNCANCA